MNLADFHFLRPLSLLGLLPAALAFILLWRKKLSHHNWEAVCDLHLLSHLWLEKPGSAARLPLFLLLSGWVISVIALAGPTWEKDFQPVFEKTTSRVLVLDLSASMNATDLVPSRLDRARFKIQDILNRNTEGRTALIVFSGEPHIVTPLTNDTATIASMLPALATDIVPAQGNSGASALKMAARLLRQSGATRGEILLISDGVDDISSVITTVASLKADNYRVSVLGIGTPQGAPIPLPQGGVGKLAALPEASLKEISRSGSGHYARLTADNSDLNRVAPIENHMDDASQKTEGSGLEQWIERGPWLLIPLAALASLAFRRGWLVMIMLPVILPRPVYAFGWADLWLNSNQQGIQQIEAGQPEAAESLLSPPEWRGVAQYRQGKHEQAADSFKSMPGADGDYNQGNALARAGKPEEAIAAYQQALEANPDDADAQFNLDLVKKLLDQNQNDTDSNKDDSKQEQKNQGDGGAPPKDNQAKDSKGEEQEKPAESEQARQNSPGSNEDESKQEQKNQGDGGASPKENQAKDSKGEEQEKPAESDQARQDVKQTAENMSQEKPEKESAGESTEKTQTTPQEQAEQQESSARPQESSPPSEKDIALEQWLRKIPDDPSGLLRRKFELEHLLRQQAQKP